MIGPKNLPIEAVPNCCRKNRTVIMPITIPTMVDCWISLKACNCLNPSIAEVTVIGGVMMPSAKSAAPPSMAGLTNHFLLLRTRAYTLKMPPSPLLSALRVRITYLTVVCKVSVHMIQESEPNIRSSVIARPLIISFKT